MEGGKSALASLEAFRDYLLVERRYSPHTVEAYCSDLDQFEGFLERKADSVALLQAGKVEMRLWLRELSDGVGASTMARKLGTLRTFYRFLQERGLVSENPATGLRLPKVRKKLPMIVSAESANELLEMTGADTSPAGLRDNAVLELLYGCGLRVSEAVGIDCDALDLEGATLNVLGKGKKERVVPVGAPALRAVLAYLPVRETFCHPKTGERDESALFLGAKGGRLGVRRVQEMVARVGALATGRAHLHPHALRHACATHMLEGGADLRAIQDLLGHETVATTQRYTHLSTQKLTQIYDRSHPLSHPPKKAD